MTPIRLATARQSEAAAKADRAGDATDTVCRRLWRNLGRLAKQPGLTWLDAQQAALTLLRPFPAEVQQALGRSLVKLGQWSYTRARRDLIRTTPRAVVVRAALRPILEDEGSAGFDFPDLLELVFPPPDIARLIRLVNSGPDPWHLQLERSTRLASPDLLASILAYGITQGKSQTEIMRDLLPAVNGVRVTARRLARTEGIRVAHAAQMDAHAGLGDLIVGYQIHCVKGNPYTRHWHRDRDGTRYYRNPGPGQLGYDRMPRPPEESPDPRDRPVGTPQTAPNCLCFLLPLIDGVDE